MDTLSFHQKTLLFNHLTNPNRWKNTFNLPFFTDETRKWRRKEDGVFQLLTNNDQTKCKVIDTTTNRSLLIEKLKRERIRITDETKKSFSVKGLSVGSKDGIVSTVEPIHSSNEFGFNDPNTNAVALPDFGIILRFNPDGSKAVFLENLGHRIDINTKTNPMEPTSAPGQFFHQVIFTDATFEEWKIHPAFALIYSKLVVAKDLNIEPDLYAFNELDEEQAAQILAGYLKRKEKNTEYADDYLDEHEKNGQIGIAKAEKPWNDTTEFSGYHTALPRRFFIERIDTGYNFLTSSDAKHSIVTQGEIIERARKIKDISTIPTQREKTSPKTILSFLNQGHTMTDHLQEKWNFIVLESPAAKEAIFHARDIIGKFFDLDYNSFAAINYSNNLSFLAMKSDVLEEITERYNASLEAARMIEEKNTNTDLLKSLIKKGADYRYINPDGAKAGKTFYDVIKKSGNNRLLSAIEDIQGADATDYDDIVNHLEM